MAAHNAAMLEAGAETLAQEYGGRLALPPGHLAVAIQSLSLGFIYQHQMTPDLVTEAVIVAAFEALADGAERQG